MYFSIKAIKYFLNLKSLANNLKGVKIINPYESAEVQNVVKKFFTKFYSDNKERLFMIGINPGRFGGGLTGIFFTDPVALKEFCGIDNNLGNKKELSSTFIYELIAAFGGTEKFFSKVFMTAIFPLAPTYNGKNFNYYDNNQALGLLLPEIIKSVRSQIRFGARKDRVIILGKKNAYYFELVNKEYRFFNEIIVLNHPRFIMQYRKKQLMKYYSSYLNKMSV